MKIIIVSCLIFLRVFSKTFEIKDNTLLSYNVNFSKKVVRINNITIPQELFSLVGDYSLQISDLEPLRIPVCLLKKARYQYTINLIMEQDQIIKGELSVPASDCSKDIRPRSGKLKITIKSSLLKYGKRPLLLQWKEKEEIHTGGQSWLIRYWYIVVPISLFLFMPVPGEKI